MVELPVLCSDMRMTVECTYQVMRYSGVYIWDNTKMKELSYSNHSIKKMFIYTNI